MKYIEYQVKNFQIQKNINENGRITSGSKNYYGLHFTLDTEFSNLPGVKTCEFYKNRRRYSKDLVDGYCAIPNEILSDSKPFEIRVISGNVVGTTWITIKIEESDTIYEDDPEDISETSYVKSISGDNCVAMFRKNGTIIEYSQDGITWNPVQGGENGVTEDEIASVVDAYVNGSSDLITTTKLTDYLAEQENIPLMEKKSPKNIFNENDLVNGFVSPYNGEMKDSDTYVTTGYIAVTGGKYLVSSKNGAPINMRFVAQFDTNQQIIAVNDGTEIDCTSILLNDNCAYIRVTPYKGYEVGILYQLEVNDTGEVTPYETWFETSYQIQNDNMSALVSRVAKIENDIKSPLYGKKVAWIGTSITQQYKWCKKINTYYGFDATNCGVGGTAMCYESVASMCTQERLLGQYADVTDENTGEVTSTGVAIPSDVEIIFVEAGTNDWARNKELGSKEITFNDDGSIELDTSTYYGACHQFFKNATELFPNAIIIAVGAPFGKMANRDSFTNSYGLLNNQNLQTVQYGDALVEVAGLWGFKGFNIGRISGINDNNIAEIVPDGLHLTTDKAIEMSANAVINELNKITKL